MLLNELEAETSRELFQFRKYFGQVMFVVETVKTGSEHVGVGHPVFQTRVCPNDL